MPGLLHIPESASIALHTCLWLAEGPRDFRPSPAIARALGFSYNHFAKVVQRLVRARLLETERGPKGGIRLARDPRRISLLEIYDAGGGEPLVPHRCLLDPSICAGRACAFGRQLDKLNARYHRQMARTTLAALARSFDPRKLEPA